VFGAKLGKATASFGLTKRFWGKRKEGLTREQALDARPLPNLEAKASTGESGELVLEIKRRRDLMGRLLGFVIAAPLTKKVCLDEMGSFVWNLCDGQRSVREIASLLAQKYKLNRREAVISLTSFLRSLGKRGLMGFALMKENQDGNPTA
jgi:hypothetical protein